MANKSPADGPQVGKPETARSQEAARESNPADETPAGLGIPDHELLRCIGRGSYGEVWLARNVLGQFRAVKVVYRKNFEHERPYEREFEGIQKFEPISRLHESQVDILHVGRNEEAGFFYYIMELADDSAECGMQSAECGIEPERRLSDSASSIPHSALRTPHSYTPHTLKLDLYRRGRLPADECISIGLALTTALEHLHSHGLVHRDVKPSNIIFINGTPKLADIGLVASTDATMSFVGTSGFVPPEGPGTPQGDLYSLGKVLYEISMGRDRTEFPKLPVDLLGTAPRESANRCPAEEPSASRPADGRTAPKKSSEPSRDPAPDAALARLLELNAVIVKACHHDPRYRYASAQEMAADLALLQNGKSVKRKRVFVRRWKLAKNIALVVILLALVVASAMFGLQQVKRNRPLSPDPEATRLYQDAVYLEQRATPDATLQAIKNLTEAVERDPQFVHAYFRCFEIYTGDWGGQLPPRKSTMANFRWVRDNLRAVDRNSAQYHTVNAFIKFLDWHVDEAINEIKLAVKLDPKFGRAHGVYAWIILRARGDTETAHREFQAAERIGGSDVINQMQLGTPYYVERDFRKAIGQYEKALELEPRSSGAHILLAEAYEADKQYGKALNEYEEADRLRTRNIAPTEARYNRYRSVLATQGPREMWQTMLDEARQNPSSNSYDMARLCARLGDTKEVFVLIDQAWRENNGGMVNLLIDDCWDTLRDDPRYQERLEKMGFSKVLPGRK